MRFPLGLEDHRAHPLNQVAMESLRPISPSWISATPQLLCQHVGPDKSITYTGYAIQLSVLICLGVTEGVMLVVMAFDRYVAICQPLRYTIIMHPQFCRKLVLTAWLSVLIASVTQSIVTFQLPFCTHHHRVIFFVRFLPSYAWHVETPLQMSGR
ncbi:Olfactory Receptor 2C1 [Manis pentadactyla]|nr:Olfactory Receptor 2C1 [Manis pentadactyla]